MPPTAKPTAGETPDDWTELVQTRISPRAQKALEEKIAKDMSPSKAHTLRRLIYVGLGLAKDDE